MSSALMKSGVVGMTGLSRPLKLTCWALAATPQCLKDIREANTAPTGVAHRTVARLAAGNARLKEPATVARTLVDRDDFDLLEFRFQFGEGKLGGLAESAFDFEPERFGVDRRRRNNREMVTHEVGVVGSEDALVENGKGSLELRRAAGVADERALLRVSDERTFAVFK